ncbi:phage tail tape measure protein [Clostridium pasteurianum]|uniref:phage tail tape measure protein n=1 Tax=Clostridium pasteurianum TaxID=1501 RepID=UPI002260BA7D|nr:phage tail tape measure protein [Clostridium pasteurianum]UZW13191.1 phage tail tape measure protein [Clostridium pasteurianum]
MADTEKRITAKMVLDDTGFNRSLQGVNQQLRLSQSELKSASAGIQAFGKDSERLAGVQKTLAQQVELQAKKVDVYRQSIEKTQSKMEANITARDKLKNSLDMEKAKLEGATQAYGRNSQVTQNISVRVKELTEEYNDKQKAVEANAKSINTYTVSMNRAEAELSKFQGELNKTTNELNKSNSGWLKASEKLEAGSKSFKAIGEGANNAGNKILGITAPLVGVGVAAAKVGMDFDSQMSRVKAISGATGDEFQKLRSQAMQLGADTAFSSKEAAEGMENLASAGFNTNEIMAAMPGMLDLAASSGEDLANSSDIAASTLRGFGIEAGQAGHVADVLAKNASATNAAVADTGEAMKYIAPVAHAMGMSLEETTAAIGIMANAGIKGSQAGTTLRGALSRLASPSKEAAGWMKEIGFQAFDSQGKMLPLNELIGRLQKSTSKLTDEQKQNAIATIFGQEAMSGMISLVQAGPQQLNDLTKSLKSSNGAAKDMANTMQDNAKSSIEQMMGSLETAGIKLADNFAPTIKSVADTVGRLADAFGNLDPSTQKMIINATLATVAVGGTLKVVGGLAGSIGNVLGLLGKFSGALGTARVAAQGATMAAGAAQAATAGVGAATAGATVGAGGLAAGLGGLAIAAAPWLLAGAAVVAAGVGIHHVLSQQVVPQVDLFNNKIKDHSTVLDQYGNKIDVTTAKTINFSEATKKQVGAYIQLDEGAKKALTDLFVNGNIITDQTAQSLTLKYNQMGTQIKAGMDKHYQDQYNIMQQFFQKSNALSDAQEQASLTSLQSNNNLKKSEIDKYEKQIQAILQNAANNHRAINQQEQQQINAIQEKMKNNAVKSLSSTEVESKVILQRLKDYGTRITAEQASEVIKNANKQRDGAVRSANDQYNKTISAIIQMRDGTHSITADQAEKLIADAKRQRDSTVSHAEGMRNDVVKKVVSMNSSVSQNVDTTTGDIKTKWQKVKDYWDGLSFPEKVMKVTKVMTTISRNIAEFSTNPVGKLAGMARDLIDNNASGTNNFRGGLTTMHEEGYEVYNLPRGSKIYNHEASEDLVKKTAESVATKVASSVLGNLVGSGNQSIIVPVNLDGREIARVVTPYVSNNVAKLSRRR